MPAFEGASALVCDPATQQHRVISCFIANTHLQHNPSANLPRHRGKLRTAEKIFATGHDPRIC